MPLDTQSQSEAMLCKDCADIFDCRRRDIGEQYLQCMNEALSRMKEVFGSRSEVDDYENYVQGFARKLQDLDPSGRLPCPWYPGNLSWLDGAIPDFSFREIGLSGPRDGDAIVRAAAVGCELCKRICCIGSQYAGLSSEERFMEVKFRSGLYVDSLSLRPAWLTFKTRNGEESYSISLDAVCQGGRVSFPSPQS